jgi:allophanate hydrolase
MNLLDYSAIAIPAGFQNNGIPFGVTLFAPAFYDLQLIKLANHLSDKKFQLGATGQFYENPKTDKPSIPENFMPIVVCGAHMAGLPLNHQLTDRKGIFIQTAKTKPGYRLYKLPGDSPKRPALVADDTSSTQLDVEVWAMPKSQFGSFLDGIPSPLGLGKVKLEDGSILTGFIAEQNAILQAEEITHFGNWRNYINQ